MLLTLKFSDINSLELSALVAENRKLEEKIFTLLNENENLIRTNKDIQEKAQSQSQMRCYNLKYINKIDDFKYYTGFSAQVNNVLFYFLCPVDESFQHSKTVSSLKMFSFKDQFYW